MRSLEAYKGIVVVTSQATIEAVVVGCLCVVRLHWAAVIIPEVAFVDCCLVCIDHALRGLLLLVGRVLGAVGPQVLCQFGQEGMDGAQYLAIALGLFIA